MLKNLSLCSELKGPNSWHLILFLKSSQFQLLEITSFFVNLCRISWKGIDERGCRIESFALPSCLFPWELLSFTKRTAECVQRLRSWVRCFWNAPCWILFCCFTLLVNKLNGFAQQALSRESNASIQNEILNNRVVIVYGSLMSMLCLGAHS